MTTREDRISGVMAGMAAGDALGAGYEGHSRRPPAVGEARMVGGGLGGFAPGEWTDDTSCAVVIARAKSDPLDTAAGLLGWYACRPPDIGPTSGRVLAAASKFPELLPVSMINASKAAAKGRKPGSVSNGSLMRTGPVCLPFLGDWGMIARRAREISDLTHYDPLAGDACVIWSLAIGSAIEAGGAEVPWLIQQGITVIPGERQGFWQDAWADALMGGMRLRDNWDVVGAFKAALNAAYRAGSLEHGLQLAVSLGGDTDTVAAIAGALLGAMHGASAVPAEWVKVLHGWPGLDAADLGRLALDAAGIAASPQATT